MNLITHDIKKILGKITVEKDPILEKIIKHWKEIIKFDYSNKIIPNKIIQIKVKNCYTNTLCLEVENASIALEVGFQYNEILNCITECLGYKAITKLKINIYKAKNSKY